MLPIHRRKLNQPGKQLCVKQLCVQSRDICVEAENVRTVRLSNGLCIFCPDSKPEDE